MVEHSETFRIAPKYQGSSSGHRDNLCDVHCPWPFKWTTALLLFQTWRHGNHYFWLVLRIPGWLSNNGLGLSILSVMAAEQDYSQDRCTSDICTFPLTLFSSQGSFSPYPPGYWHDMFIKFCLLLPIQQNFESGNPKDLVTCLIMWTENGRRTIITKYQWIILPHSHWGK